MAKKKSAALSKITTRAKQIRKNKPAMKWANAIKQAGADYRAGRLGAVKIIEKGEKRNTPAKKVYRQVRNKKGNFKGMQKVGSLGVQQMVNGIGKTGGIGAMKSAIAGAAKNKLAGALLRRDLATTKRDKKKIGKLVTAYRKEVKKYS